MLRSMYEVRLPSCTSPVRGGIAAVVHGSQAVAALVRAEPSRGGEGTLGGTVLSLAAIGARLSGWQHVHL